ncbi:TniQ family protein [Nocardia sp. NPDC051052]|uniref:TniQ family protein n=1 Tax=Nocardia sp. NPDC051052 TaxID=3364322 RepID=UPI00378F8E52
MLDLINRSRPLGGPAERAVVLPRTVTPITGEQLSSYLPRLARANHLTLAEVLAVLPPWFATKVNNPDELAQHHMLAPATTGALSALARLARTTPQRLAGALPAFGATHTRGPVRATTACHLCTARRGVGEPIPVHLPVHLKVCTRHGIWLSDTGQPNLDVTACPDIIAAQHRINRLLRQCTPQQLIYAHESALAAITPWPATQDAIPLHWRHRLPALQTLNHHRGLSTDHDAYTRAAKFPDAIALVPEILSARENEQDLMARSP